MQKYTKELFETTKAKVYQYRDAPFTLASGKTSHHYFNSRKITMHPKHLSLLATALCEELLPKYFTSIPHAVGGLTLGADPIAYALSLAYLSKGEHVYPFVIRKEPKGHGLGKQLEAEWNEDDKITSLLVLEDTITTGGSSLKAIEVLQSQHYKIQYCCAIIDREEGAREYLSAKGVTLISLFKASDYVPS